LDSIKDDLSTSSFYKFSKSIYHNIVPIKRRQDGFQRQEEEGEEEGFSGTVSHILCVCECHFAHRLLENQVQSGKDRSKAFKFHRHQLQIQRYDDGQHLPQGKKADTNGHQQLL
jgi:hypothetical protein